MLVTPNMSPMRGNITINIIITGGNMYDTINIKSPYLDEVTILQIERFCNKMCGIVIETQEKIYEFTRGELEGSSDYRIKIQIFDYIWVKNGVVPEKQKSLPYIVVECSLHKLFLGHNVIGGSCRIKKSIHYLVGLLQDIMNVNLPCHFDWIIERIDIAYIYDLGSNENILKLIYQMKNLKYPKRKVPVTYPTSIYFCGSVNTTKIYAKYQEFIKRDYKRIIKYYKNKIDLLYTRRDKDYDMEIMKCENKIKWIDGIKERSKSIIRIEVEIKKRKILDLFGKEEITVIMLDDNILKLYYNEVVNKLFVGVEVVGMKVSSQSVLEKLRNNCSSVNARSIFCTWSNLALNGEHYTMGTMSKTTYYRHIQKLKELACYWVQTDIFKLDVNPIDTFLNMLNKNCIEEEDIKVIELLRFVA